MVRHEVVIHPEAPHGVVDSREDSHRDCVGVLAGDALVHLEQVAVALGDYVLAQALDGVAEVQIHGQPGFTHAAAFVADLLGVAGSHVARNQVAEAGVLALQVIIPLGFGDLGGRPPVAFLQGHPHPAVVAQGFAHERELGLVLPGDRDASRVDLRETRIRKQRAALMRAPDGGGVGALRVRREVIDVPVSAGSQHHRIGNVGFDLAGQQVAGHNAAGLPIDHDQVQHLGAGVHLHVAEADLLLQRLVGAEQKLLARLAAGVECAGDLRAAERPGVQIARVFARERNALRHALIDDVHADLRETVDVGFAGAEIPALDRVVEQPKDAVAVVAVVLGGIDAALRGDRVGAARRILEAEALDPVPQLGERGGGRTARQPGSHYDDRVLALIGRIDQLEIEAMAVPAGFDRAGGAFRVEFHAGLLSIAASPPGRPPG